MAQQTETRTQWLTKAGRIGLSTKGLVYLALGALAFMSAFEMAGHNEKEASREGVFQWMQETGGSFLLWIIAIGLACYCIWRFSEAFRKLKDREEWKKGFRYLCSAIAYASVSITAVSLALHQQKSSNSNTHWVQELLSKPFGIYLVGVAALVFAGIGFYQLYYGYSGKYRKHVEGLNLHSGKSAILLNAGKVGYMARGIVWLLLAYLLMRAAINNNAAEAGDTSKVFQLVEKGMLGSWILGAIGLGLIAYGIFSFVRARYESFRE